MKEVEISKVPARVARVARFLAEKNLIEFIDPNGNPKISGIYANRLGGLAIYSDSDVDTYLIQRASALLQKLDDATAKDDNELVFLASIVFDPSSNEDVSFLVGDSSGREVEEMSNEEFRSFVEIQRTK